MASLMVGRNLETGLEERPSEDFWFAVGEAGRGEAGSQGSATEAWKGVVTRCTRQGVGGTWLQGCRVQLPVRQLSRCGRPRRTAHGPLPTAAAAAA
jgi:hypothetical protein